LREESEKSAELNTALLKIFNDTTYFVRTFQLLHGPNFLRLTNFKISNRFSHLAANGQSFI